MKTGGKKLTLTQLKRFLPLSPPPEPPTFPENINRYLSSPSFSNLSVTEQTIIQNKYRVAYRNYYTPEAVVEYLGNVTGGKYSSLSILRAISNCAQKYGVIDWYKLIRVTLKGTDLRIAETNTLEKGELVNKIIGLFRRFLKKRVIWRGVQEIGDIKNNLQEKVLKQFMQEAYNEVRETIEKNRIHCEQILYDFEKQSPEHVNFISLEHLINGKMEMYMDRKKVGYLYLFFDQPNKGYFPTSSLLAQLLVVKKQKPTKVQAYYLTDIEELMGRIREEMRLLFYSAHEMLNDFASFEEQLEHNQQISDQQGQINLDTLYLYLSDRLKNRYSKYHTQKVYEQLIFKENLQFLYNKPKGKGFAQMLLRMVEKKKKKRQLKKQNDIFYSYKTIIMYLVSKCKKSKLNREEFYRFVCDIDPLLKYRSFYCVWRVYPGIINVDKLKRNSGLNPLACYLKLRMSEEEYEQTFEDLLSQFPPDLQVNYDKVEQKINLSCEFVLELTRIKPLELEGYSQINYHQAITRIFQPDLDIDVRRYIHTKVAEKAYALWKGYLAAKEAKQRAQILSLAFNDLLKPSVDSKQTPPSKKLNTQKSKASITTKKSQQPKINPQTLEIVAWNIEKLLNELHLQDKAVMRQFHTEKHIRNHLCVNMSENYVFRTATPRISLHGIQGVIGLGQQLMFLKDGKMQKIRIKFLYKPGIEIIDFTKNNNDVVLLTSYFSLQFYNLSQESPYSYQTIQLLDQVTRLTSAILDKYCHDRVFSKYPVFLRSYGNNVMVNSSLIDKKIKMIDTESRELLHQVSFTQKEHVLNGAALRLIESLQKHPRKVTIANELATIIAEGDPSQDKIFAILQDEGAEDDDSQPLCASIKEAKQIVRCFSKFNPSLAACMLKQQLGLIKKRKIPDSLGSVIEAMVENMEEKNISLREVIDTIDKEEEGIIKMKALKDYLLKITQEVYLYNQKQIDAYLRSLMVGRDVTYESVCEIMLNWKYAIWERPHILIRDFLFIQDASLLFYVIEGHNSIFAKNFIDNKMISVLPDHDCTPCIEFIPQRYILISGDHSKIRIWRVYDDLIGKFDELPPWEMLPYAIVPAHQDLITSITYLSRAHVLVTTSLDSTTKFWAINPQKLSKEEDSRFLKQIKRIYSEQDYFLNSRSQLTKVDSEGCFYETLVLAKISKQINENNKFKFQSKVQVFEIENSVVQAGKKNVFLQLPPKLAQSVEAHAKHLGNKKKILLAKKIKEDQTSIIKANLITKNLQHTLYQAVKRYYIFGSSVQLVMLANFLSKRPGSESIYLVLMQKYGVGIPSKAELAPVPDSNVGIIHPKPMSSQICKVSLPKEELDVLLRQINLKCSSKDINIDFLFSIASEFIFGTTLEAFQEATMAYLEANPMLKEKNKINKDQIPALFAPYQLSSEIQVLYSVLRTIQVLLTSKKMKVWQIFCNNQTQLQKKNKVNTRLFTQKMKEIGLDDNRIQLIISYLARADYIYLQDFVYYLKVAWSAVAIDLAQSNFSQIFMKNSRILQSRLEKFKLDSGIAILEQPLEEKLKKIEGDRSKSSSRDIRFREDSASKNTSDKNEKKVKQISEIQDPSGERSKSRSKDKSRSVSRKKSDLKESRSHLLSSSPSRLSLSHDSLTKDSFSRQAQRIVKSMKQKLKNQGKSLWEIASLAVLDFMESPTISEHQYFNIFKGLASPVYLRDKLHLMDFIMRESNQYSSIDINILFELFEIHHANPQKPGGTVYIPGEKYIISFIISKMAEVKMALEHALVNFFFSGKQELTVEEILQKLANDPFNMETFCLREFEHLLMSQNKSAFILEEFKVLLEERMLKYNIKADTKQVGYIDQLIHLIYDRNMKLEDIIPKPENNASINFEMFRELIMTFFNAKSEILENQFIRIVAKVEGYRQLQAEKDQVRESPVRSTKFKGSPKKQNKQQQRKMNHLQILQKSSIKYKELLRYLNETIQQIKSDANSEKDSVRRFLRTLEAKKINLLTFFISLDSNRAFFINEIQFKAGLAQLKITHNFWPAIKKKKAKRLYYSQLINYLIERQVVNYKCVDSELEAAMTKFIRRFMRNDDLETVFDRVRDKEGEQTYNATYDSFHKALRLGNAFKDQETFYIFSAFVNANNLKKSIFSNDEIIKDEANYHKTFNFKMFADTVGSFKNDNITKTPHYKFCSYLKKRGVSLLNEFIKWMERNKKNKEIADALKSKQQTINREHYANFIRDMGTGLTDKEVKELIATYPDPLDFSLFNQKLEQMYKKGNMNVQSEEISNYFQIIFKKIKASNTTIQRLFEDFSSLPQKMNIKELMDLCRFLETGLTKIQIRAIFGSMDLEKKQFITLHQLQDAIQEASETIQKQQDEYELDYAIEKLLTNKEKYVLKPSKIRFTTDRASIVFANVLSREETLMVYQHALGSFKSNQLSEDQMQKYLTEKDIEMKAKKDKKYKQLILNFLKFLQKVNIDTSEAYCYFANDSGSLTKNKFLLLYQSLELRTNIVEINALYSYLDQKKSGVISQSKWDEKLNIVQFQKESAGSLSGEQLQVFYKAKLLLSDIYLIFVRKLFRPRQIYSYFDTNGTGKMSHSDFLNSVTELGIVLEKGMDSRLLNYLDRQRSGQVSIGVLVYELENCLGSKEKTILQAKSSCIFKAKIHLIQEKQQYFIDRLVGYEHFISIQVPGDLKGQTKMESCILATQFLGLIKDFGIVLDEDEYSDVQRNFQANKDNLKLYPLYFMFINIFKSIQHEFSSDTMERRRYQRLFEALIKNGLTMKIFQKVLSVREATGFLTQLKIFTPIEVKLLIESITPSESNVIDLVLLSKKVRDSYLQGPDPGKSMSILIGETKRSDALKTILRQSLDPDEVINALKANSGKISKSTFQKLLCKLNLIFTTSEVSEFYEAFSEGKDFILIQSLLSQKEELSQSQQAIQEPEKDWDLMLDHICKSLNFKGVSLQEAWQRYYLNHGFITEPDFYEFLAQIGFNVKQKQLKKSVQQFLNKYYEQSKQTDIKTSTIQKIITDKGHCLNKLSKTEKYEIKPFILKKMEDMFAESNKDQTIDTKLLNYISENSEYPNNDTISVSLFYGFIKHYLAQETGKKLNQQAERYVKFFISQFASQNSISLEKLTKKLRKNNDRRRINTEEDEEILIKDMSADALPNKQTQSLTQELTKVCQQNFIWSYNQTVDQFCSQIGSIKIPYNNLSKLALNFLFEKLLVNDYLVFLEPKLGKSGDQKQQAEKTKKRTGYLQLDHSFKLKTLANLIVEKQQMLANEGIWRINDKYLGINVTDKHLFQQFAIVSTLLDSQATFLRAKNYYLWDPNDQPMPKGAINYRWKFIAPTCLVIAKQLKLAHDSGYAMPHLRWQHLHLKKGIHKAPFPCRMDSIGRLQTIPHKELFKLQDPYTLPEVFWGHPDSPIQSNYVSWILGCIFYQFIWGHSPRCFMHQLIKYVQGRHCSIELEDVFSMQQLPSDFYYTPFAFDKIHEVLKFEHCINMTDTADQLPTNIKYFGLRGILKSVEQLYGQEFMYFKAQFDCMEKLLEIVEDCLIPIPSERPPLDSIISRLEPLCIELNSVQFLEVLKNHQSAIELKEQLLDPLEVAFLGNDHRATDQLIQKYEKTILKAVSRGSIRDIFCLPKYYPWPTPPSSTAQIQLDTNSVMFPPTQNQIFNRNLMKNRQKIRMHSAVNIITLLQESSCFEMLNNLYLSIKKEEDKQRIFLKLLQILMLCFESLRNYSSPLAGFIPQLLQSFIQIIFDQPFSFQDRQPAHIQCSPQNFAKSLTLPKINKPYKQKAISFLKRVVYLNGCANIEFLPLHHFMQANLQYRMLFEYFYSSVTLVEGGRQQKQLALNYFRDRMTDDFFWNIISYIRVDSIVFNLLGDDECQQNALLFFRELSTHPACQELPIFYSNIFYLQLGNIIAQVLISIDTKAIALQIIINLIRFGNMKIFRRLNEQAFSILKEMLKLAVEPTKDTSQHQEYQNLYPYLKQFVGLIYSSKTMMEEVAAIQGAEFILDSFVARQVRQERQGVIQF